MINPLVLENFSIKNPVAYFSFDLDELNKSFVNDLQYKAINKYPSIDLILKSSQVHDKSYKMAIDAGLLPSDELESLIDSRNIITKDEAEKLIKFENQLEAQNVLLSKTVKVRANQDRIKKVINKLSLQIRQIKIKKFSKMMLSADVKAEEDKLLFLCAKCTYNEEDKLFWESYSNMLLETNLNLKDEILFKFIKFYRGIDSYIIRKIARSSLWRIRYISSQKTSDQLFGVPTSKYTVDMVSLAYWSNFYQSIYEMMPDERPSDFIIEDDETLDTFMAAYYDERTRQDAYRKSKVADPSKLSSFDKEEVIVTKSNELYQDIKYDTPREAQKIKDRTSIKKRTKRG